MRKSTSNIIECFPEAFTPRQAQVEVLERIESAINRGITKIIVQAPTGSGKSHISATLANYSKPLPSEYIKLANEHRLYDKNKIGDYVFDDMFTGDKYGSMVLTVTKALQDQYNNLFDQVNVLKGRSNYICAVDEDFNCDYAPCTTAPKLLHKCLAQNVCPFFTARRDSLKSKMPVLNYSTYLNLPDHLKRRQIIVWDEASELEDELVKHFTCDINYKLIRLTTLKYEPLYSDDKNTVYRWLGSLESLLARELTVLNDKIAKLKGSKVKQRSAISQLRIYTGVKEQIGRVLHSWYSTEYITEITSTGVKIVPINVDILASNIFNSGDVNVFLSGTIIDHATYAKTLGIDEYEYIEIESEFDPDKSPIYCLGKYKLNRKNLNTDLPKVIDIAKTICDKYSTDKGIIHTHTHAITKAMSEAVSGNSRFLVRSIKDTNEDLMHMHALREDSTVLISPSMGFGTDLEGDAGRFCIVLKIPYLSLGDRRVKILAERSSRWYQMKALVHLVQMCGRTTRSNNDHSVTFILDGQAVELIKQYSAYLPKYFIDRIQ